MKKRRWRGKMVGTALMLTAAIFDNTAELCAQGEEAETISCSSRGQLPIT